MHTISAYGDGKSLDLPTRKMPSTHALDKVVQLDCAPCACPQIYDIGHAKAYEAGEALFWEEGRAESYYLIESGVARCCRLMSDGRRQICRFAFPGDLIAHSESGRYPYTVEAVTPIRAVVMPRTRFENRAESNICLRKLLMKSVLAELHESQDQIMVLGRMTAAERVANFLCLLAERTHVDGEKPVTIPMGRMDMADYLGLTLETVSRVISRLKREGKIELINSNLIVIRDHGQLSEEFEEAAA